jgi:CheY-like chemotaxis protein
MPHRVLVVDDDREIRESLMEILEDHGYEVVGAANGRDALDKLQGAAEERPCMIFLDLMMPVMDGAAFREEQLRKPELAAIPVVVISAYRDVAEKVRAMQLSEHLGKPLQLEDLIAAARRHCPGPAPCGLA